MKLKRILAAFLTAVMFLSVLTACGAADAIREFFTLNDALRHIHSGTFHEEVTVSVSKELSENAVLNTIGLTTDDVDADIDIEATLDMSINCKAKKVEIILEGSCGGKEPMRVTSGYIEE